MSEVLSKIKDITGAITGVAAVLGLLGTGWLAFSGFIDKKIDLNIEKKLKNEAFLLETKSKFDKLETKIDGLYEVDSGYSVILSFDFKSRNTVNNKIKFYADKSKQDIILSIYPVGSQFESDDFKIKLDNINRDSEFGDRVANKKITNLLDDDGAESQHMHSLVFIPNTEKYASDQSKRIERTLEVFILVKNKG